MMREMDLIIKNVPDPTAQRILKTLMEEEFFNGKAFG